MDVFVKIDDTRYAASVSGILGNRDWDERDSKAITVTAPYEELAQKFVEGAAWSIITVEEDGKETEYDNSEYSVAGDIIVHRDGTATVMMGKPTDLERALVALLMQ